MTKINYEVEQSKEAQNIQNNTLVDILEGINNNVTSENVIESIVDDGFQKCFERRSEPSWNYVWYLAFPWFFGVLFRWFILFPIRLVYWILGHILFIIINIVGGVYFTYTRNHEKQKKFELYLVKWLAYVYVSSWSGVVRFHGEKPRLQKQVFVARVPLPPDRGNSNLRFVHIRFGQSSRVEHGLRRALRFRLRDFPRPFVQVRVRTFRHVNPRAVLFRASDDSCFAFRRHFQRLSLNNIRAAKRASTTVPIARGGRRSSPRRE